MTRAGTGRWLSRRALVRRSVLATLALTPIVQACGGAPPATGPATPTTGETAKSATGATPAAGAKAPAQAGGSILFAQFQSVPALDPIKSGGALSAHEVFRHIYEGLVVFDESLTPRPALAERWETPTDGKTWTFHLRKGVQFHDGTPADAKAVKEHFDYLLKNNSLLGFLQAVEAPDETTLKLTTKEPFQPLLGYMAHAFAGIISPTARTKYGDDYSQHAAGAGPYKVKEFVPNEQIVLVRNDTYYGGRPKLDQITFRPIPEDGARANMLETGEADVIIPVPANSIERLKNNADLQIVAKPVLTCQYLGMNLSRAPFDDLRVRKALSHAVDVKLIVQRLHNGYAHPLDAPMAAQAWGHAAGKAYDYSPDKAKALLAEAGWKPGSGGILEKDGKPFSVSLWTPQGLYPKDVQLAETIQAMLKAVGVEATLRQVESGKWFDSLRVPLAQASYDLFLWSLTPTTGDGNQALTELFRSDPDPAKPPLRWNLTRYKNEKMDRLVDEAARTIDEAKRKELMKEAQALALEEAPLLFLYSNDHVAGIRKHMQGVRVIPNRLVDLREASVSK